MRTSTTVILRQLQNEGVLYDKQFGLHWFVMGHNRRVNYLGSDGTFEDAVADTLSRSIRIAALLSKLQDSLEEPSKVTT